MKKKLKLIGIALMSIGAVGLVLTLAGMMGSFNRAGSSASALAESTSVSLIPSMIGGPFFVIGLILFVLGWLQGRKLQRAATV